MNTGLIIGMGVTALVTAGIDIICDATGQTKIAHFVRMAGIGLVASTAFGLMANVLKVITTIAK